MGLLLIDGCCRQGSVYYVEARPVRSDKAAAAAVSYNPRFEPRPQNYTPNHTRATPAQLVTYKTHSALSFLSAAGNSTLTWVDGQFTGTTDEILQWGAYKWGFDPNLVRAIACNESWWHQNDIGASIGILQVRISSFPTTYPLSLRSTAFDVDFKLAYQRACMNGNITYLARQTPLDGHHRYPSSNATEQLWGCVGDWYSGAWYDRGAITYIAQVKSWLASRPWITDRYF